MDLLEETKICLIRHGETAWNAQLRIQGQRDLPLNDTGFAQAAALAKYLARQAEKWRFTAIYSSDLTRARQTAEPLAAALGLTLRIEAPLRERNFGCCEGLTREEIRAADPAVAEQLAARDPDYLIPGGESLRQHLERVSACLSHLARQHAGQRIAVITHGGALDLIYRRAHGLPIERPRDFPLPNAAINTLIVRGEDWRLESWGEVAHLDGIGQAPFVTRI